MEELAEFFLRWKMNKTFEFKFGENGKVTVRKESEIPEMLKAMHGTHGQPLVDLWKILMDSAKKDPEGRWVSASNAPIVEGQATIGGRK